MPLIPSAYAPPFPFTNGHIATIYSGLLRKVKNPGQERERLELPDGDFLDLDWSYAAKTTHTLVILLHGLEGTAQRPYILGSINAYLNAGLDTCAVNFRGCSGEPNRLFRSYHSGVSDDLESVIFHILNTRKYTSIIINGFSLGGNVTLKYLGEGRSIPKEIKAAIAVSVPCSLYGSMVSLHTRENYLYARRFKNHLLEKLKVKQTYFPERVSEEDLKKVVLLRDFDEVYTARAHGFKNGEDYYQKASSLPHLDNIEIPTYILNAANDSFLNPDCYPEDLAKQHKYVHLEMPKYGGHVGFYDKDNYYYNERRAIAFTTEKLNGTSRS